MMAPRTTAGSACRRAAPLLTIALASAWLAACGTHGPSAEVVDVSAVQASNRFSNNGTEIGYSTVTPRAWVDEQALADDAPESYTVVRGDTLWDISDRFLKEPWLWPKVWNYNPQIANPHLIYPGDVLALEYVNGEASLVLTRNGEAVPMVGAATPLLGAASNVNVTRMSPRIRSESLDNAVPTIAGETIRQFLVQPRVVDLATLRNAPYILGNAEGQLMSSMGNRIYARGTLRRDQTRYGVYRQSEQLVDPVSGDVLGYEIDHVADAKLMNIGDPSTLTVISNNFETIAGDILLPSSGTPLAPLFTPRLPEIRGDGRIVSLVNAISQTGRNQVIVLNLGERSGISIGDVLAIESRGGATIDERGTGRYERVELPNTRTGVVMVFQTFDKVSYGLVMESTRPVGLNDIVTGI